MRDPYQLHRFVDAQDSVFDDVCEELRAGRKSGHWMWFIFPQMKGLGRSALAQHYAIRSRLEAEAYANHPILGPRLRQCSRLVNSVDGRTILEILGNPDDLKFRSSMTLFAQVSEDNQVFVDAIRKYFAGEFDPKTTLLLI